MNSSSGMKIGTGNPMQRCPFPNELPSYMLSRYRRLVLVTSEDQITPHVLDNDSLIVTCDWLSWHKLIADGRHAVYFELGTLDWQIDDNLNTDLFLHDNDWILDIEGDDPTIFRNVSLGRLFGAEMNMAIMNYHRLHRALASLIKRFDPEEVQFVDFRYDVNHLSRALRRYTVRSTCEKFGVRFSDASNTEEQNDHKSNVSIYRHESHGRTRLAVLSLYVFAVETLTFIRGMMASKERRPLVLVNSSITLSLIRGYLGGQTAPYFFVRTVPRRLGILWHCFVKGIRLVNPWSIRLSHQDRDQVAEIFNSIDKLISRPADGALAFSFAYVREIILSMDVLMKAAADVRQAETLLDRCRPGRVVVDGVRSRRHLIYMELANARGIAVDYIWHAPMLPQNMKLGALGGDPRQPVLVSRVLSWGTANERWLERVGFEGPVVRVGSPLRDKFAGVTEKRRDIEMLAPKDTNVLLLQYAFNVSDLAGICAQLYGAFVNAVYILRQQGYQNIRMKLHPGPGRWTKAQFDLISNFFDLDCEVQKFEPFEECLDWADIVIGPSQTGALFETLAAGKSYHALQLPPHSAFDGSYFEGFPIITDLDQLSDAIYQDNTATGMKLLDELYSINEFPSPSRRFWEIQGGTEQ